MTTIFDIAGRNGTRERLLAAGEALMRRHGFESVSLEEIARHAGQANKYAVQYHFAGRSGLAQAILDLRIGEIERRRGDALPTVDHADPRAILTAFLHPIAEQVQDDGQCTFALFLLRFATQVPAPADVVHPLVASEGATKALFRLLCATMPHVPVEVLGRRLSLMMNLPLAVFATEPNASNRASLAELVDMIVAALAVPHAA